MDTVKKILRAIFADGVVYLFLFLMAIIELMPIMWMFSTSLRPSLTGSFELPPPFLPTKWQWTNYLAVINSEKFDFPLFFFNSVKIAVITTFAQLLTCSMAAYSFARLRFPGRNFLFFLLLVSMMIPGSVTFIPVYILIAKLGLIDSHAALIWPAVTSVFGIFLLRQYFLSLPGETIDSAKIDGAGFFRIYWNILLPLVGPGLSALGVLTFLGAWNSFYSPLLFLRSWDKYTLPIGLLIMMGSHGERTNPAHVLAAIMLSILPVLIVFLFSQRYVLRGISLTGLKG